MSAQAFMEHQEFRGIEEEDEDQGDGSTSNKEYFHPRKDLPQPYLRLVGGIDTYRVRDDDIRIVKDFHIDANDDFASMTGDETQRYQKLFDQLNVRLSEVNKDFIEEELNYLKGVEKTKKEIQFKNSLQETRVILKAVLESFPLPEIVPLGSGGIEFEWFGQKGYRFGIRVKGENKFIYSGLFGSNASTHGTEEISGDLISILEFNLSRLSQ